MSISAISETSRFFPLPENSDQAPSSVARNVAPPAPPVQNAEEDAQANLLTITGTAAQLSATAQNAVGTAPETESSPGGKTVDSRDFSGRRVDMSGLFSHGGGLQRSKYINAFFSDQNTLKQLQNSFNSSMASLASALEGNPMQETAGMRKARHSQRVYEASQVNLDELKQETEIRARRAQAEARQSASDEARLQRAEAAAPRDENGEPILELSPGGAPAPAEVQAYAPGGSGPELSQEELESRNIQLQVKTPSVKVNIKV